MYLRPVNTLKHVIDKQGGLVANTADQTDIAQGVDSPILANKQECEVGSHVKSIFLNVQVAGDGAGALSNVYMMVFGNPGNNIAAGAIPNANTVGNTDFKKQVFHQEMLMTEKAVNALPRTLFKGVLKIPRKFGRMGQNDRIAVQLFSPGVNYDFCIQSIYKEIR